MNWHRVDFNKLIVSLLIPVLRIEQITALLECFIHPITELYASFLTFKKDIEYKLRHNSQVCHLQAILNDQFDNYNRHIYIKDTEVQEWSRFLWRESEDKPIMLNIDECFMLGREGFIGADAIDFIVCVPKVLNLKDEDYTRMHAYLRYYKLASKRYTIQEYE